MKHSGSFSFSFEGRTTYWFIYICRCENWHSQEFEIRSGKGCMQKKMEWSPRYAMPILFMGLNTHYFYPTITYSYIVHKPKSLGLLEIFNFFSLFFALHKIANFLAWMRSPATTKIFELYPQIFHFFPIVSIVLALSMHMYTSSNIFYGRRSLWSELTLVSWGPKILTVGAHCSAYTSREKMEDFGI